MPMWMLLAIFLVFPLIAILNGGTTNVAVESHLAGARLRIPVQAVRPAVVAARLGAALAAAAPHFHSRAARAEPLAVAEPVAVRRERRQRPQVALPFPSSPKNSSTLASTKCSPRSPAKAARA